VKKVKSFAKEAGMKNLKRSLFALIAIAHSTQCAELYLNNIVNKTGHDLEFTLSHTPPGAFVLDAVTEGPIKIKAGETLTKNQLLSLPTQLDFRFDSTITFLYLTYLTVADNERKKMPSKKSFLLKMAFAQWVNYKKRASIFKLQEILPTSNYTIDIHLQGTHLEKTVAIITDQTKNHRKIVVPLTLKGAV